jgi:hypothetical protein
MVTLTISEKRYQQINAPVEARRLAAKLAEAEATDLMELPDFTPADKFLAHLDAVIERSTDDPAGRSSKP